MQLVNISINYNYIGDIIFYLVKTRMLDEICFAYGICGDGSIDNKSERISVQKVQ